MAFYAYMLRCADGSYYVGHTEDLDIRLAQHRLGVPKCYTSKRRPVRLVWCEAFPERYEALVSERRIKGWSRAKKDALIRGDWAEISRLAAVDRPLLREVASQGLVFAKLPRPSRSSGRAVPSAAGIPIPASEVIPAAPCRVASTTKTTPSDNQQSSARRSSNVSGRDCVTAHEASPALSELTT